MSLIFNQILILFIPVIIGYLAVKHKIVDKSFGKNLSSFLFNITLPCSIVSAMQFNFEPKMLVVGGVIIVIGTVVVLACFLFGFLLAGLLKAEGYEKRIIRYAAAFSNFSFMGYPVAEAFLGPEGLFYATIFSIPVYIFVQSLGMTALVPPKEGDKKFRIEYILNPPLAGIYIGIALFILQIKMPYAIEKTIFSLGDLTTPLAMTLAGLVLNEAPLKNAFMNFRAYVMALFRLVIIPLTIYFILKLFNFDEITTKLPVIVSMMPVAANLVIVSTNYDGDVAAASQYVLLSTLLSLFTIPLMGFIIGGF